MNELLVGVIGSSRKESEKRLPIHPKHISKIPKNIREMLIFENGYGESLGVSDEKIVSLTGGVASRIKILSNIKNIILTKPVPEDLAELQDGCVVWGWFHCIQDKKLTQVAIDKKLTLISFEDMFSSKKECDKSSYVFSQNRELAGYCAVLHALQLKGINGRYGDQKKILVIGFGSVSHGAIYALLSQGYKDITVCVRHSIGRLTNVVKGCKYVTILENFSNNNKLIKLISKSDIIINGILQDPNNPIMFIGKKDFIEINPESLIIDVSCDKNMGFFFSKPTTFKSPMIKINSIDYYGVDNTPNYLWESATRGISEEVIKYLPNIILDKDASTKNKTLQDATNIKKGIIYNRNIISFQNRAKKYPYEVLCKESTIEKSTKH